MAASIFVSFILAIICLFFIQPHHQKIGWVLAIVPFGFFFWFLHYIPTIQIGSSVLSSYAWFPALSINFSFYLDGLSLLFCLLITGIGALVFIYSSGYMGKSHYLGRYYSYLFLFMGSMLGLVLSSNLLALFIFWELTSLASYLLISFENNKKAAVYAANQALIVTLLGGIALLIAILLIAKVTGSYELSQLLTTPLQLQTSHYYLFILFLMFIAAFTKSAQYPFHFWLPNAMQAPTPVSAYLHSATMVKAGIYLLMRFYPLLSHSSVWFITLTIFGSVTMLISGILALRESDLKRMLAYSTVMALGTLVFLLASHEQLPIVAALIFLIAHALYKSGLFLAIGKIDHIAGSRELQELGGLYVILPLTFIAVLLLAASMAGLPPMLGFIGKELVYEAKLSAPIAAPLLIVIGFTTNVIFIILAAALFFKPFLGPLKFPLQATPAKHIKPNKIVSLWLPSLLLGILGFIFGILPWLIDKSLIAPAASNITASNVTIRLQFWHGFTPSFTLSLLTFIVAIASYWFFESIAHRVRKYTFIYRISPEKIYYLCKRKLRQFTDWQTSRLQSGYLRHYTAYVFLSLVILMVVSFLSYGSFEKINFFPHAAWFDWLLCGMIVIAATTLLLLRSYLNCILLLGFIDLCTTLIYLVYAAPDVAMTQILVGILTVIIIVLTLYRLPSLPKMQPMPVKIVYRNALIAIAVGSVVTILLLTVTSLPFYLFISNFYADHSYPISHGRNIVNVIIVDFRALDTLGEIIVIATAGLGIYGLFKNKLKKD